MTSAVQNSRARTESRHKGFPRWCVPFRDTPWHQGIIPGRRKLPDLSGRGSHCQCPFSKCFKDSLPHPSQRFLTGC